MSTLTTKSRKQTTLNFSGFAVPEVSLIDGPALTLRDRCDQSGCNSAALVRFVSSASSAQLLFCGSDARKVVKPMVESGWLVDDQTESIFENNRSKGDHT